VGRQCGELGGVFASVEALDQLVALVRKGLSVSTV